MKKTTKGAIAAGSAALLLAGGAGTMAAWSSSAALGGGTVTAGHMTIVQDPTTPGVWTWGTPGKETTAFNLATDRIVPGDIVTYTANYQLDLAGTNLKAKLTAEAQGITGTGGLDRQIEAGEVEVKVGGATVTEIVPGQHNATVATSLTFKPETIDQVGAAGSASLADATVVLKQTAPAS